MKEKTLYEELGVERIASKEEIRKAYRSKAAKLHPDVNKDPEAEQQFKRVCEAYLILYDDTSRWKYDQTGQKEKPSDRKPIDINEQVKLVLHRIVFAVVDKLGSSLNDKNIQAIIRETALGMRKEVMEKLANNKALLKAAKEKVLAVSIKQTKVETDGLLFNILKTKINHINTQEILPLRENRKSLLRDRKIMNKILKLIETSEFQDITIDSETIDPMDLWDQTMACTWEDPRSIHSSGGPF